MNERKKDPRHKTSTHYLVWPGLIPQNTATLHQTLQLAHKTLQPTRHTKPWHCNSPYLQLTIQTCGCDTATQNTTTVTHSLALHKTLHFQLPSVTSTSTVTATIYLPSSMYTSRYQVWLKLKTQDCMAHGVGTYAKLLDHVRVSLGHESLADVTSLKFPLY